MWRDWGGGMSVEDWGGWGECGGLGRVGVGVEGLGRVGVSVRDGEGGE